MSPLSTIINYIPKSLISLYNPASSQSFNSNDYSLRGQLRKMCHSTFHNVLSIKPMKWEGKFFLYNLQGPVEELPGPVSMEIGNVVANIILTR